MYHCCCMLSHGHLHLLLGHAMFAQCLNFFFCSFKIKKKSTDHVCASATMRECFRDYLRYVEKCLGIVFCLFFHEFVALFLLDRIRINVWSAKNRVSDLVLVSNFVKPHLGHFFLSVLKIFDFYQVLISFLFILI